ncbi:InlB B-repeat-containing protein [Candidatus Saccharibacteria bacterium]|nr:InlB B-repeat-containing protein [Candidatus Saccharibacteria bacterium]
MIQRLNFSFNSVNCTPRGWFVVFTSLFTLFCSCFLFSHSAYAGTNISISNSSETISFDKVQPTSAGVITRATDTLTVTTDCSAGYNVYISSTNGGGTSLVNNTTDSNNEITALSGTTIGSTALALSNNTWGFNTVSGDTYYGLPAYTDAMNHTIYSGTNDSVSIYYGAKVTDALTPGKYTGQVLYTVTVNPVCLSYAVIFNKNADDATGSMSNQTMTPSTSTALTANGFSRPGYVFLGWSTDQNATTPTYTDGQSVTDLAQGGGSVTLYAVWGRSMQDFGSNFGCAEMTPNTTITLYDSRDNQGYTIYRIPTNAVYPGTSTIANIAGRCIMTKDINLGAVNNVSGASSSITANSSMTLSPTDSGFTTPTGSGESITVPTTSVSVSPSWDAIDNYQSRYFRTSGTGAAAGRGYYSWGAAMVVCPKGWRLPTGEEFGNGSGWNTASNGLQKLVNNNINTILQSPYTFELGGFTVTDPSSFPQLSQVGYYWASTQSESSKAYSLVVATLNNYGLINQAHPKQDGFAVRCVSETANATGYMQNFDANTLSTNEYKILADKRDSNEYAVKKLADGKVWMAENLKLTNYKLTPADSNVASDFDLTTLDQSGSSDWCTTSNTTCYNKKSVYYDPSTRSSYGALYNYYTVTAGESTSYRTGSTYHDICPKGWRLPTGSNYGEINNLYTVWGSSNAYSIFTGDYTTSNYGGYSSLPGYINGSLTSTDSNGYWWSATSSSTSYGFSLGLTGSVSPNATAYRYRGYSARCIVKPTVEDCTGAMTPGASADTACKMQDGHLWAYGNNGATIAHNTFCPDGVNCNNSAKYCPAGFTIPSQSTVQALIDIQGASNLYPIMTKRYGTEWQWIDNAVSNGWVTGVYTGGGTFQFGGLNYEYMRSGEIICRK